MSGMLARCDRERSWRLLIVSEGQRYIDSGHGGCWQLEGTYLCVYEQMSVWGGGTRITNIHTPCCCITFEKLYGISSEAYADKRGAGAN